MKRIAFVVLIAGLLFSNGCKSTTSSDAPEPAKPKALYTGVISVGGAYFASLNIISFNWVYTVTNTNSIGASVIRVETFFYDGSTKYTGHTWYPTGTARIEGNQTYKWQFFPDSYAYTGFKPDKAQVMMYVKDDNGYDITIANADPVTIIWVD